MNSKIKIKKIAEPACNPLCMALKTFIHIVSDNADSKTFCGLFFPYTF